MKRAKPGPAADGLCWSICAAIHEYVARHNGAMPAKINMTMLVYSRIMSSVTVRYQGGVVTAFGIPVVVTDGEGYSIHLAEPEIPIYEIPKDEPQIHLPPDYVTRGRL